MGFFMSDKKRLTIRSLRATDFDDLLDMEKSFGKGRWTECEHFLGPTRFVSVVENRGKIVGYQVTYTSPTGEPRAKVCLKKGFEDKEIFQALMKPTFLKHGVNMKLDYIRIKD
jgi:hypothetical protein